MIQKGINFLKSQVWTINGIHVTVGAVIAIAVVGYLLFIRK